MEQKTPFDDLPGLAAELSQARVACTDMIAQLMASVHMLPVSISTAVEAENYMRKNAEE